MDAGNQVHSGGRRAPSQLLAPQTLGPALPHASPRTVSPILLSFSAPGFVKVT